MVYADGTLTHTPETEISKPSLFECLSDADCPVVTEESRPDHDQIYEEDNDETFYPLIASLEEDHNNYGDLETLDDTDDADGDAEYTSTTFVDEENGVVTHIQHGVIHQPDGDSTFVMTWDELVDNEDGTSVETLWFLPPPLLPPPPLLAPVVPGWGWGGGWGGGVGVGVNVNVFI